MSELPSIQGLLEQNKDLSARAQELEAQNRELAAQTQALQSRIKELEEIRRNLEHLVEVYKRHLFGSRSEKIDAQELEARVAQAAAEAGEQVAQQKRPGDPPPEAEEEQPEENSASLWAPNRKWGESAGLEMRFSCAPFS